MADALAGIRVLDFTRVVAGPFAGQMFGDLGADVIKVERRGGGDDIRQSGPPWMRNSDGSESDQSTYVQGMNRNKRSLTVDFTNPAGVALLHKIVPKCHVFIENFRTGTLAKYGLGYEDIRRINPAIVYCSITGFGQTGPYSDRSGYDYLIQAMGGVMAGTGVPDGEPGAGPMRVGLPVSDILGGMNAMVGILAALRHSERTGVGQHVDIALLDAQISALMNPMMTWLNAGIETGRTGNKSPNAVPYGPYQTADGFVLLATSNDREFLRLAEVVGHPEWGTDPRFQRSADRVANRHELETTLTALMAARPSAEWIAAFNAAKVSCGPINKMADIEADPHVNARDMMIAMPHPAYGKVKLVGSPLKLSETPVQYRKLPPLPGEQSREILQELAEIDDAAFDALVAAEIL